MSALSVVYIIQLKQKAYLHANSISNIKLILEKNCFLYRILTQYGLYGKEIYYILNKKHFHADKQNRIPPPQKKKIK